MRLRSSGAGRSLAAGAAGMSESSDSSSDSSASSSTEATSSASFGGGFEAIAAAPGAGFAATSTAL